MSMILINNVYINIYIYVCMYICMYVCIYIYVCMYVYTYCICIYCISISLFVEQCFAIVRLKKMQTLKIIIKCLQIDYFSGHAKKS